MLRKIARTLGLLSLGMGWLNLTEITHKVQLALFIPKIVAGALPLPTALIGGAAAVLGLWRKDRLALLA
ncbi:MAG: hypothetical protein K8J31_24475, partial [Anaerolineae bacterium]|nr:hypothetical protein [Anaerolineae bacterium]